jgi:hypothetical protein
MPESGRSLSKKELHHLAHGLIHIILEPCVVDHFSRPLDGKQDVMDLILHGAREASCL